MYKIKKKCRKRGEERRMSVGKEHRWANEQRKRVVCKTWIKSKLSLPEWWAHTQIHSILLLISWDVNITHVQWIKFQEKKQQKKQEWNEKQKKKNKATSSKHKIWKMLATQIRFELKKNYSIICLCCKMIYIYKSVKKCNDHNRI